MTLFDYAEATKLRDAGMKTASDGRGEALQKARQIAFRLANLNGQVTADDVRKEYELRGGSWADDLGNAAGSLFKSKLLNWQQAGWTNSTVTTSHARALRIWKLK